MTARVGLWARWTIATTVAWGLGLAVLGAANVGAKAITSALKARSGKPLGVPSVAFEGPAPVVWYARLDGVGRGLWRAAGPTWSREGVAPWTPEVGMIHARADGAYAIANDGIVRFDARGHRDLIVPRGRRFLALAISRAADLVLAVDIADRHLQVADKQTGSWQVLRAAYESFPAPMDWADCMSRTAECGTAPVIERGDGAIRVGYLAPGRGLVVVEGQDASWRISLEAPAACPPCALALDRGAAWLLSGTTGELHRFGAGRQELVARLGGAAPAVHGVALAVDGRRAYAAIAGADRVVLHEVDLATHRVEQRVLHAGIGTLWAGSLALGPGDAAAVALLAADDSVWASSATRLVVLERRDGRWAPAQVDRTVDLDREAELVAWALVPTSPIGWPWKLRWIVSPITLVGIAIMAAGQAWVLRGRLSRAWRFVPLTVVGWAAGRTLWFALTVPGIISFASLSGLAAHLAGMAVMAAVIGALQSTVLRRLGVTYLMWSACTAVALELNVAVWWLTELVSQMQHHGGGPGMPLVLGLQALTWTGFGAILGALTGVPLARACAPPSGAM